MAREDFLRPGPWQIVRWGGGYRTTPDPDPVYLYTDDVIGILPERNLNNGQPSLHAALIAAAAPQPGSMSYMSAPASATTRRCSRSWLASRGG